MTPAVFIRVALDPALSLLPAQMDSAAARALTLAIAMQESGLRHRRQIGGPARGYAMFERAGVAGVLTHPATAELSRGLCAALDIKPTIQAVYEAIECADVLAVGFARLLLWTDAAPLPSADDTQMAWRYYQRTWRPGRPRLGTWPANYATGWGHSEGA